MGTIGRGEERVQVVKGDKGRRGEEEGITWDKRSMIISRDGKRVKRKRQVITVWLLKD